MHDTVKSPILKTEQYLRLIRDTLMYLGRPLFSREAFLFLALTGYHESGGLREVRQVGGGPACTLFQIEPNPWISTMRMVLEDNPSEVVKLNNMFVLEILRAGLGGYLASDVERFSYNHRDFPTIDKLVWQTRAFQPHRTAVIAARYHTWKATSVSLPPITDKETTIQAYSEYWGKYYNTRFEEEKMDQFRQAAWIMDPDPFVWFGS